MEAISLKGVWLEYKIDFKEDGRVSREDFWALKGINVDINKGEIVGIIGENGAGKTSLLKVIAGMLKPDKGVVRANGKVSTLMEIGAGFQKDLTGKENIYLISSFFGLSKEQIEARYDDIVEFAAIGRFINAPVKSYSQGMYMRLAFAIAIHVDSDILLIDDLFVVGDMYAQQKCLNKIFDLKKSGMTILIVIHDLAMLQRLCSRGIFLRDGMLINDGPIDKVCSYYTETVGDKNGIAIMQKGPLGVVFNNGKLILRWKDKSLTTDFSGYSLMLSGGRQYLSGTAGWEARGSEAEDEITADGRWPDLPVVQHWKIGFLNENEFHWEIGIDVLKEVNIERLQAAMVLTDKYKSWFTVDKEADFPSKFIHPKDWECRVVDSKVDALVGLRSDNSAPEPLPAIIFNKSDAVTQTICQVGNTGSELNARVIVYEALDHPAGNIYAKGGHMYFSCKVTIFDREEEKLSRYLDDAEQAMRESSIIHKGPLSLVCKNNSVGIYWKNTLLTGGPGLNFKFIYKDKNYSTEHGYWSASKENDQEMAVTITWDDVQAFTQIWRLRLQDDGAILWEIGMKLAEPAAILNKRAKLMLNEQYDKWLTAEESGNFGKLDSKGSVTLNKYINEYIGVEGVYKADSLVLPGVIFAHQGLNPRASNILKRSDGVLTTQLRYQEIDFKENVFSGPGITEYFKGAIKISSASARPIRQEAGEARELGAIKKVETASDNCIKSGKLSLVFDCGKGRIFWDGQELTKGLGMYSSVLFRGIWYDSSQALWDINSSGAQGLAAVGYWPGVPLVQRWEISLNDGRAVSWSIKKEIWGDVALEREQVNIMVSDKHKEWFVEKRAHGRFPDKFREHNGLFWDRLWCGDITSPIGIKKCRLRRNILNTGYFPSVLFSASPDCSASSSVIENTDNLFQARVLQYELGSKQGVNHPKDKYFEGKIRLIS